MSAFESILNQQRAWATKLGITIDSHDYTASLKDNLYFYPMLPETQKAFESGRGKELGEKGLPGKMQALYSSSALVVNFFEYWVRSSRIQEITNLFRLGLNNVTSMVFEEKHRIANLGTPHLDIEIKGDSTLAIEAKFAEPYYHRITQRNRTNLDKYLAKKDIWEDIKNCRQIAEQILAEEDSSTSWSYLDTPQLIKHILGLKARYGQKGFSLLYLWFNCLDHESTEDTLKHAEEIANFHEQIQDEINFQSTTYQGLFDMVCERTNADTKYISYLRARYFPKINYAIRPGTKFYDELVEAESKYTALAGNPDKIRHNII